MAEPQAAATATRACPYCAETIQASAVRCKHCQADLSNPAGNTGKSDAATLMQYDSRKKSAGMAYLLWFFFGGLGAHRFYLGRKGTGAAILLLLVVSVVLIPVGIGLFTLAIPGFWLLLDLFLIPGMTRAHNADLARKLGVG